MDFDAKKPLMVSFICFFSAVFFNPAKLRAETVELTPRPHANSILRIKTVVEVAGSLQVESIDGKSSSIPLKVKAEMFFDERGFAGDGVPTVRHYWDAKADIRVNETEQQRKLRENRQTILLKGSSIHDRYTSPDGPLTREELELIDIQSSGFPLERLLPSSRVAIGDTWTHDEGVVTELLRLKRIVDGKLTSKLTEIDKGIAKIDLSGEVTGEIHGVETRIEVIGDYRFDLRDKIVNWMALSLKEKRGISFANPGFEVVARIRTARKKIETCEALPDRLVPRLRLDPTAGDKLIDYVAENGLYRMSLDRRWHLLSQRDASAILRMVDNGDLIATCKIDRLNRMVPGQEVTLEGFQTDVRRALDQHCEEIIAASETVNPQGVRVLRVEAAGKVGETPIRWVYFHLSHDQGDRVSFIFTHEASLEARFAGVDESLTSSVEFLRPDERQAHATSRAHR